jgi:hypothetical protein
MFRHEAGTNITVANTTFIKLGCENCPNMSHMEARGARVGMHVVSFLQHEDPLPFRIDEDVRLVVDGLGGVPSQEFSRHNTRTIIINKEDANGEN